MLAREIFAKKLGQPITQLFAVDYSYCPEGRTQYSKKYSWNQLRRDNWTLVRIIQFGARAVMWLYERVNVYGNLEEKTLTWLNPKYHSFTAPAYIIKERYQDFDGEPIMTEVGRTYYNAFEMEEDEAYYDMHPTGKPMSHVRIPKIGIIPYNKYATIRVTINHTNTVREGE